MLRLLGPQELVTLEVKVEWPTPTIEHCSRPSQTAVGHCGFLITWRAVPNACDR